MANKTVSIQIECGETTCASEPGKFCKFFGTMRFGTIPLCRLFPSDNESFTTLKDEDGWIQRCPDCMNSKG